MSTREPPTGRAWLIWLAVCIGVAVLALGVMASRSHARDLGQWENSDPKVKQWYQTLMQPDAPATSCCGEADAYWCDEITVRNAKTYCKITDDRADEPLRRPHRDIGQEFEVPNHKLKYDQGNPTGHSIIFLSTHDYVYCFVMGGGV